MSEPTEREFQTNIVQVARLLGFMVYHTHDSRHSAAGFPDLILVKGRYMLAIELKVGRNKATDDQLRWLRAIAKVTEVRAAIWTPVDRDRIYAELQKFARTSDGSVRYLPVYDAEAICGTEDRGIGSAEEPAALHDEGAAPNA